MVWKLYTCSHHTCTCPGKVALINKWTKRRMSICTCIYSQRTACPIPRALCLRLYLTGNHYGQQQDRKSSWSVATIYMYNIWYTEIFVHRPSVQKFLNIKFLHVKIFWLDNFSNYGIYNIVVILHVYVDRILITYLSTYLCNVHGRNYDWALGRQPANVVTG